MNKNYDIVIVGGGLVGATLANTLHKLPIKIALVDALPLEKNTSQTYDARSVALAYGSQRILASMNLWASIKNHATAIKKIHISDQGHFGITRLTAKEGKVDALGYVVEIFQLGSVLLENLQSQNNITLLQPATITSLKFIEKKWQIDIVRNGVIEPLNASLVIAADGVNSTVRRLLNIFAENYDYQQSAIVANVTTDLAHQNVAYERFTKNGPLAFLPLSDNRSAIVWTVANEQVAEIMGLSDEKFLERLQRIFGYRLGRLNYVGKRQAFPLRLLYTKEQVKSGLVVLGNAAHNLHPIAGQGFNLCLRDVAVLAKTIFTAYTQQENFAALSVLQKYAAVRYQDQQQMIKCTDGLVKLFSNDFFPINLARNLGLTAMNFLPPLKQLVARRAMGFNHA